MIKKYQYVISALVAVAVVPVSRAAFDTDHPYEFVVESSYIVPPEFDDSLGQQMTVHWAIEIRRTCPGSVVRYIIDARSGAKTTFDKTDATMTVSVGDHFMDKTFFLPPGLRPGRKIYRSDVEYSCNWLQDLVPSLRIRYTTPDLSFTILETK